MSFCLNPSEAAKANSHMDTIYFVIQELTRIYAVTAYAYGWGVLYLSLSWRIVIQFFC